MSGTLFVLILKGLCKYSLDMIRFAQYTPTDIVWVRYGCYGYLHDLGLIRILAVPSGDGTTGSRLRGTGEAPIPH